MPVDLVDDVGVRPRPGHQPGGRRVPGRPDRGRPRDGARTTSGRRSRATRSSRCSASWASRGSTSCCVNLDLDGAPRDERPPTRGACDDVRPTRPEEMLARIGESERAGRGRLRVYLGMAPGVGKTYRMLEEGHRRKARGTDVVVGFVEAHGRANTAALARGPGGRAPPPHRLPGRGRRGDGHRRRDRAPPDGRPDRRAGPHERSRALSARSAGRTWSASATPGSTSSRRSTSSTSSRWRTRSRRSPGRPVHERLPGRRPGAGRRDRARRHEPARAPPAHAPRQRLPTGADAGRAGPVLHGAEPDRAPRHRPPLHRAPRRGPARARS